MSGRNETDERYRNYTKRLLQGKPQIIFDYFYSFGDRTEMTRFHYIRNVLDFLEYLKKSEGIGDSKRELSKVLPVHINKYLQEKNIAKSSLKAILSALKSFFEYLYANRYIKENPCNRATRPKGNNEKEIVYMNSEEIKDIIQGIKEMRYVKSNKFVNRDMLIFRLGCSTGLRATSMVEIDISNIDFEKRIIKIVKKGDSVMEIKLSEGIIDLIQIWLAEREKIVKEKTDALFISSYGKRLSYAALYKIVEKHTQGLKKKISPHKMRSSCATNLYEKTGDIYLVQETLGHQQISNTKKYTKVSDNKKAKAVELLDADFT